MRATGSMGVILGAPGSWTVMVLIDEGSLRKYKSLQINLVYGNRTPKNRQLLCGTLQYTSSIYSIEKPFPSRKKQMDSNAEKFKISA